MFILGIIQLSKVPRLNICYSFVYKRLETWKGHTFFNNETAIQNIPIFYLHFNSYMAHETTKEFKKTLFVSKLTSAN